MRFGPERRLVSPEYDGWCRRNIVGDHDRKHSAKLAGGGGGTRTCNQTIMSGRISIRLVDLAAVSFVLDRVCCVSTWSFQV
jgi:hypothetical protein